MHLIGYFCSFLMGMILGLFGAGGSILTVPILVGVFEIRPLLATWYSLFVVGVVGFFTCTSYWKKGLINFHVAVRFAIPAFLGLYFSRGYLLKRLPKVVQLPGNLSVTDEHLVLYVFCVVMAVSSFSMIRKSSSSGLSVQAYLNQGYGFLVRAFLVGSLAGFVGAGGGFLIVPALCQWGGLDMKRAVGTSLLIIGVNSLAGFIREIPSRSDEISWFFLLTFTCLALLGAQMGAVFSQKIPSEKLKPAFGIMVLIVAILMFVKNLT